MVWKFYFRPILAKGEGEKRGGSAGSLAAGSTDIPVDSATSYFDVGDPIFVADTDLKGVSYCGLAIGVDADSVTVALPTKNAYTVGTPAYYVITPSDYVIVESDYSAHSMERDLGIDNFQAAGGIVYRTRTRDVVKSYRFLFTDLELEGKLEVFDFIRDILGDGLYDFTVAFWDETLIGQRVMRARLTQGTVEHQTKATLMGDVILEMFYVGEDYE